MPPLVKPLTRSLVGGASYPPIRRSMATHLPPLVLGKGGRTGARASLAMGAGMLDAIPRVPGVRESGVLGARRVRDARAVRPLRTPPKLKGRIPGDTGRSWRGGGPLSQSGWTRAREGSRRRGLFGVTTNQDLARRRYMNATRGAVTPPSRAPRAFAQKGKAAANWVAGNKGKVALGAGTLGVAMGVRNRSGRAMDRTVGRPIGMYGY